MKFTLPLLVMTGLLMSGCASSGSTPPMVSIQTEPPLACRIPCLLPPSLGLPRNDWEAAAFMWGAECKQLHEDCIQGLAP